MAGNCNIPHPLKREGTYRFERLPVGLQQGFFKPDNRSTEEIVRQMAAYAGYVKYFNEHLEENGDWKHFLRNLYNYDNGKLNFEKVDDLLSTGNVPPHLGLMLSFLKLLENLRNDYNGFTDKHLNFYYKDILQLSLKPANPDSAAVIFTPEKNMVEALVQAGTELKAGKDKTGKELFYKTVREIVVNQISVAETKSVFAKYTGSSVSALHIAKDAATENKFVKNTVAAWMPFGSEANPLAEIGFAVSTPILLAKDGRRRFSIEIGGTQPIPRNSLKAYFTGPKGWVECEVDTAPGVKNHPAGYAARFLLVKIDEALPEIACYNEAIHTSGYNAIYPVLKIIIKNDESFAQAYNFFSSLKALDIKRFVMNVEGSKSFSLESDAGNINPLKPFKPFGNTPVKNKSSLFVGSKEIFNKYLQSFHFAMNWKAVPGNMAKYYKPYGKYIAEANDQSIGTKLRTSFMSQWQGFDQGNVPGAVELLSGGKWTKVSEDLGNHYITTQASKYNIYHTAEAITDNFNNDAQQSYDASSRWGFAKITLKYDFGHSFYPNALTYATTKHPGDLQYFPAQPYTPEFNSLHVDYVLEHRPSLVDANSALMQLHPFGFVKVTNSDTTIVSQSYNANGQLYIGLAGCNSPQIVNFYFARIDGSENIDAIVNEPVAWQYLSAGEWKNFASENIFNDTTNKFSEGGFISVSLPIDALSENTAMGNNLVWIRVVSQSSANAFSAIAGIHTNATEAVFENRDNDPAHLEAPLLAGSITKPVLKIAGVKSVAQPYASYHGAMEESNDQFYARTSEMLRHRGRAWALWDYEHILLQKFPSIFKVKCITHASVDGMYVPGRTLVVALPSLENVSEKDLLQPRVAKTILAEAEAYLKQFMSTFANINVVNPTYEPITIKCKVKIRQGFDETYYAKQLNADLQTFLCPWIKGGNVSPTFSGKIYASAIINFIEDLPYIDYLTFFEATKTSNGKIENWANETSGSNEAVILTSAAQHEIDTNAIC